MTEEDVIDFTPAIREMALKELNQWKWGPMYATPSLKGTYLVPGIGGGANWGGASFDPENRYLYLAHRRHPTLITARSVDAKNMGIPFFVNFGMPSIGGLLHVKPPWSSITAYNLDSGDIVWTVPNGAGPKNNTLLRELDLPDLGRIGASPGLLVTPAAIFYGYADRESELRAMDKETGTLLWKHQIPAAFADAPPMTYMSRGKQFVVVGAGHPLEPATLTAFRLP